MIAMLLLSVGAKAQIGMSSSYSPYSKWVFGGTAGLGFLGSEGFSVYANPKVGYKLTDNLIGGLSGSLSYRSYEDFKSTVWGIGPFMHYYFARTFFATANYKHYFVTQKQDGVKAKGNEAALNIGAGYLQYLGGNTYFQIGATYNVLYKKDSSILGSPFVPYVGVIFGL